MKPYRVFLAKPEHLNYWDFSTTVLANNATDAVAFAYQKWAQESQEQLPALTQCRSDVKLVNTDNLSQQSEASGAQFVASSAFASAEAAEAAFLSYAVATDGDSLFDYSGTYSLFGPLEIRYKVDLDSLIFEVELKFGPKSLAKVLLNNENPCASIGGVLTFASWELGICLDMPKRLIQLKGRVDLFLIGGRTFDVTLVSW